MTLNPSLEALLSALKNAYGDSRVETFGCADDYFDGAYIRVRGLPVVLSAHTTDGSLPFDNYDVQIEPETDFSKNVSIDEAPLCHIYTAVIPLSGVLIRLENAVHGVWR